MKIKSFIIFLIVVFYISFLVFIDKSSDKEDFKQCIDCNIILISLDTLRADHTSLYDYEKDTTPFLSKLKEKSLVFQNAYAPAPLTLPSHTSIFTGYYPFNHGVRTNADSVSENFTTLTEILLSQGYETAAYVGGGPLDPKIGLSQGFEVYNSTVIDYGAINRPGLNYSEEIDVFSRGMNWIAKNKDKKFFLFLHTYQIHDYGNINDRSFVPNNNYYSKQCMKRRCEIEVFIHEHMYKQVKDEDGDMIDYITGLYDSAIHDVDRKLNRFINFLDSNNLLDNTIVIIVADHGEELGEHGHTYHISTLYEEELKVPFITIIPPNKVMNVDTTKYVSLIDVYPTLLDLVNISHPSVDGKNILKAKSEPDLNNRVIFADLNVELEKYALMEDSKKLILSKKGLSGWIQDNMIKGLNALEEHNQNTKVWSKNVTYFKIPFNGKNTFEIGSIMNPNSYIKDFSQGNKTLKYETIKNNSNWVYLVEVYRENTSVDDYLRMDVETFNLKKRGSSTDDRDLGLFIDWVLIRGDKNETFFTDLNKTSKTQEYECYDLKEDILEKNNLPLDKCPLNKKKEVLWEIGSISNTPHLLNRTLDKDIEEKLLALGYI